MPVNIKGFDSEGGATFKIVILFKLSLILVSGSF